MVGKLRLQGLYGKNRALLRAMKRQKRWRRLCSRRAGATPWLSADARPSDFRPDGHGPDQGPPVRRLAAKL